MTGSRTDVGRAGRDPELTEVASLALPGEQVPVLPATISSTEAAVAAYAEAVSEGVADELRRLVTGVMWPQEDITDRLASPDIPSLLLHDPDLTRIVSRSDGTIVWDGQPLTTAGWRRIRQWRQEWLALPSQVVPAVTGPDQVVRPGTEGLRYLAGLAGTTGRPPLLPVRAGTGPPGRPACGGRPGGLTGLPVRP